MGSLPRFHRCRSDGAADHAPADACLFSEAPYRIPHRTLDCALVRREVFNAGNFDPVNELLSPDYAHHDPTTQEFGSGIAGFTRLIGYYREATPDLESGSTTSSLPATGSWIAGPGVARHQGQLMAIRATGRPVSATGISIHRIADGRIAETWNNYDRGPAAARVVRLDA